MSCPALYYNLRTTPRSSSKYYFQIKAVYFSNCHKRKCRFATFLHHSYLKGIMSGLCWNLILLDTLLILALFMECYLILKSKYSVVLEVPFMEMCLCFFFRMRDGLCKRGCHILVDGCSLFIKIKVA
jgi:hypothetical protein